jgi:hypothetical protein
MDKPGFRSPFRHWNRSFRPERSGWAADIGIPDIARTKRAKLGNVVAIACIDQAIIISIVVSREQA